ncbi:MAG TPA: DoxX family protein [Candidatus Paceibacterota bacterium]
MKKAKIAFWISTAIIFIFEGILPILTSHNEMSVMGITHLGYPVYFITMLAVFKFIGGVVLIFPQFSARVKEWAYAGFGLDFIAAFVSILVVDKMNVGLIVPVIAFGILAISYTQYHKLKAAGKI